MCKHLIALLIYALQFSAVHGNEADDEGDLVISRCLPRVSYVSTIDLPVEEAERLKTPVTARTLPPLGLEALKDIDRRQKKKIAEIGSRVKEAEQSLHELQNKSYQYWCDISKWNKFIKQATANKKMCDANIRLYEERLVGLREFYDAEVKKGLPSVESTHHVSFVSNDVQLTPDQGE